MKYQFPINPPYRISQKFAENKLDYSQFGLKGHNGIDVACVRGTPILCPFNGKVLDVVDVYDSSSGTGYGNYFRILVIEEGKYYEWTFGHILPHSGLEFEQDVYKGDKLALVDSTGYSTGDHLHFGVRELKPGKAGITISYLGTQYEILNYYNEYLGYIDPMPFFDKVEDEIYAVDLMYHQNQSTMREISWKFIHEKYAKDKAKELAMPWSERFMKAFVYGYYPIDIVFDPAMVEVWRSMHYPEYLKRLGR